MDQLVREIAEDLKTQFDCHTVILYGSRARGDWTDTSDYDVLGVSDTVDRVVRHAYRRGTAYVDGFVYPTSALTSPTSAHIYMRDGVVIFERDHFGQTLLSALASLYNEKPTYPADELEMKRVWIQKMIDRAQRGDVEGHYRKHWLIYNLLEDYFAFRTLRYEGPKKAFAYLSENDRVVYDLFNELFSSSQADVEILQRLATAVIR